MEKDPQAGAQGRYRTQTTVSHSALSPIFRSSAGPWSTGLLGLSKRPGGRLETTAGSRLGIRSRYPFGRALTIGQDMRLETAFTCDISGLSWSRSFVAQLISDGIGQFGVAGKVVGEGTRISLLGRAVPVSSALSAGAIDGGLHMFTAVLVTVSGITATLLLAPLSGTWRVYAVLLVAVLISAVILAAVSVRNRWQLVAHAAGLLADCLGFIRRSAANSRSLTRRKTTS